MIGVKKQLDFDFEDKEYQANLAAMMGFAIPVEDDGFGLDGALSSSRRSNKLTGILNGIDYDAWNPESDALLRTAYSAESIDKKYENKKALRERFLLADNEKPIIAHIGRLDPQKGLELVRHAIFYCVNHGAQFVLLGSSPEPSINAYFWHLKNEINDKIHATGEARATASSEAVARTTGAVTPLPLREKENSSRHIRCCGIAY